MKAPQSTPKGMASHTPAGPIQPPSAVAIMAPSVTVHGMDRSMWPSRITIMAPDAMMPRKAPTWSCCRR